MKTRFREFFAKSLLRVFLEVLWVLKTISRSITGSKIFTKIVKYSIYGKIEKPKIDLLTYIEVLYYYIYLSYCDCDIYMISILKNNHFFVTKRPPK